MSKVISQNRDFLFLYEAIQCNPNGDPDQENKPRMDYDTRTNLVTDVRVKRYIRDYLKGKGEQIFVDMEGSSKVTMDERMKRIIGRIIDDEAQMKALLGESNSWNTYLELKEKHGSTLRDQVMADKPADKSFNLELLAALIRHQFIDIRMFGSAFAVKGFNRAMTGPIQLNWGYSLNPVYLLESNTISSIMNDDSSTFGKDHRVKYSLLAFHGSINARAAETTGLTENDISTFRDAIWNSISAQPTRSKLNQYPKLYLEITYQEGVRNGFFGDLRNLINSQTSQGKTPEQVRALSDLNLDVSNLIEMLQAKKEEVISSTHLQLSPDLERQLGSNLL